MFVSDRHRLLFVHVQKTGGLTVERHLSSVLSGGVSNRDLAVQRHSSLSTILKNYPDLHSYFVFGVVRNPWSRMVSWWRMIERVRRVRLRQTHEPRDPRHSSNMFWADMVKRCPDFESFLWDGADRWNRLRRPQVDYLVAGDRLPDFVGRTETLESDLRAVVTRLDLPWTPLPGAHNADPSPITSYRDFYSDSSRDRVAQLYAKDIEHFSYSF